MLLIMGFCLVMLCVMLIADIFWTPPEVRRAKKIIRKHNKRMNSVIDPRIERRGHEHSPWDKVGGRL